jgi:hypothetical protein
VEKALTVKGGEVNGKSAASVHKVADFHHLAPPGSLHFPDERAIGHVGAVDGEAWVGFPSSQDHHRPENPAAFLEVLRHRAVSVLFVADFKGKLGQG